MIVLHNLFSFGNECHSIVDGDQVKPAMLRVELVEGKDCWLLVVTDRTNPQLRMVVTMNIVFMEKNVFDNQIDTHFVDKPVRDF